MTLNDADTNRGRNRYQKLRRSKGLANLIEHRGNGLRLDAQNDNVRLCSGVAIRERPLDSKTIANIVQTDLMTCCDANATGLGHSSLQQAFDQGLAEFPRSQDRESLLSEHFVTP